MGTQESNYNAGSIILSFFVGGLVGAGIALLLAPKTGQETREQIKRLAEDAKDKADSYIDQAKSKATEVLEKGKELVEKERSILTSAIDAGKEAFEREKEKTDPEL